MKKRHTVSWETKAKQQQTFCKNCELIVHSLFSVRRRYHVVLEHRINSCENRRKNPNQLESVEDFWFQNGAKPKMSAGDSSQLSEPMLEDSVEEQLQPFVQSSAITSATDSEPSKMSSNFASGGPGQSGEVSPSSTTSNSRRSTTPDPARKKRKLDPSQQMQMLYDFMRRYRREDGSELCESFIRAPKRRTDPAYYEVVTDPIDMLRIQQKLKMDEYTDLDELKQDFQKLFANTFSFYKKGSQEFKDGNEMSDLFNKAVAKVESGEDPATSLGTREESEDPDINEQLEDLFATVMTATDPTDPSRMLNLVFRLLPSQKRYPEYYQVITEPIDLKTIATKIVEGQYTSINQCEDDLYTMCKNAMTFNEPGSQIYRDAKFISKLVKTKKTELDVSKTPRESRGVRSTRRAQPQKKHYAAEISSIPLEESESDDESSEEEDEMDTDDPIWILYNAVRYFKTAGGNELAEPFLSLPSKRELPDYYDTIQEPISLNMIRKKMKNGNYNDYRAIYEDLTLMFENCKIYNRPDSRLYKDGCRLQRVLKLKLDEIEAGSDIDEGDEEEEEEDESDSGESVDEKPKTYRTPGRKPMSPDRKLMRELYNTLMRYRSSDGVQIINMFMEKPSKKNYPDYYEVIDRPMDMKTINEKIKANAYKYVHECVADFRLMFANCRRYNEEGSDIFEDAMMLERVLMAKAKVLQEGNPMTKFAPMPNSMQATPSMGGMMIGKKAKKVKSLQEKTKTLFETLRDFKDQKGRQLSLIFLRLPNMKEFPDYYEVIKQPIDFERIGAKLKQGAYISLESCLEDFELMFDNACKFNEPDSQIYKDALTLHGLAKQTYRQLLRDDDDDTTVPDVNSCVQEILSHIFTSMYNHQDADERCYSDSLAELPEHNQSPEGTRTRALNLDIIKRRLDKGLYKRLDLFQRDIFAVLDRARKLSRTDSQVFEDSVELQSFFIKTRDEACDHGEILQSRALLYTQSDLMRAVEEIRGQKQLSEQPEDDAGPEGTSAREGDSTNTATFNQQQYRVGDFVYVESKANRNISHIFLIENMYTTKEGIQMMYANQFFRPVETFHVPSRKFLEQEVFCSDVHQSIPLDQIIGRCCVVSVKDYFRVRPDGFEDRDVYVCESRYNSKARSFKKMKIFWNVPEHINMVSRPLTLESKRVQSVFKDRIEKHKEEIEELEALEKMVEEDLPPNVTWENNEVAPGSDPNNVYYEQYTIPGPITLRRGDAVYVRAENGKNLIAQIDTMWTAPDGMAYFHGPWFVTPREIQQTQQQLGQLFYRQEAMISTIQDTNPLLSIVGLCCVLEMDDYIKSRPTQYEELNVYVCENVYDESRRIVRPLPQTGLKGYDYQSTAVVADEVFYFKNPIQPLKEQPMAQPVIARTVTIPTALSAMDIDNEDSLDAPPSVGSADTPMTTPSGRKVKLTIPGNKAKSVTPYIVFASEVRKSIVEQNKARTFGEISRLVGEKWKTLTDAEKSVYEERSKKINEENVLKHAEEVKLNEERKRQEALAAKQRQEQLAAQQLAANGTLNSVNGLVINNSGSPPGYSTPGGLLSPGSRPPSQPPPMGKTMEPIFHTVPPRPQRLLHSEAYIRYIEGLTSDSQTMCNWERQLKATKENTKPPDEAKLPAHWLADNGDHTTSLDALWALRDFLTCDSLGLTKLP